MTGASKCKDSIIITSLYLTLASYFIMIHNRGGLCFCLACCDVPSGRTFNVWQEAVCGLISHPCICAAARVPGTGGEGGGGRGEGRAIEVSLL